MRLRPGLRPGPRWGSLDLQRSPRPPIAGFKGAASRRGGGEEREGKGTEGGKGKEQRDREGREREREGKSTWLTLMRSSNRAADWLRQALRILTVLFTMPQ